MPAVCVKRATVANRVWSIANRCGTPATPRQLRRIIGHINAQSTFSTRPRAEQQRFGRLLMRLIELTFLRNALERLAGTLDPVLVVVAIEGHQFDDLVGSVAGHMPDRPGRKQDCLTNVELVIFQGNSPDSLKRTVELRAPPMTESIIIHYSSSSGRMPQNLQKAAMKSVASQRLRTAPVCI
jgi:hypothetical protein